MTSAKKISEEIILNLAERTFGEVFREQAAGKGMSKRYQQSLRITQEGDTIIMRLDYRGDNDEPLGVWFEHGTRDHFIAPVNAKVLSWIEDGKRFFSKGHFVKGITATNIMNTTKEQGLIRFEQDYIKQMETTV